MINNLFKSNCLRVMPQLEKNSVDMVLCDLPYGITRCKWDCVIPFDELWDNYSRIVKDRGAIVLFGSEPFSSALRLSNLRMYKYDCIWQKEKATNFLQAKQRIGKTTENIMIFYKKQPTFNPQMRVAEKKQRNCPAKTKKRYGVEGNLAVNSDFSVKPYIDNGLRYPIDVLRFNRVPNGKTVHPTQKPVALLEYLIKTFTNVGDVVLDNCMGSGSTGVACVNTGRKFIGIEKNEGYFEVAKQRILGPHNTYTTSDAIPSKPTQKQ